MPSEINFEMKLEKKVILSVSRKRGFLSSIKK
jgi:hypothetical protein